MGKVAKFPSSEIVNDVRSATPKHWDCFKGGARETLERLGGAPL